jgi:hypothetical protein
MAGASDGLGSTACGHRVSRPRNSENTPTVWPLNHALDSRVSTLLSVREAAQIDGSMGGQPVIFGFYIVDTGGSGPGEP